MTDKSFEDGSTAHRKLPPVLFAGYAVFFILLGLHPYSREVWIAENIPIVLIASALAILYLRGIRFSNAAYLFMSVLLFMHTVGGHYTFERVPFGWFSRLFGFERNMYDRVAHFSVGFYAFAILELSDRHGVIRKRWVSYLFAFCVIATVAMSYEIIEWQYAVHGDAQAGAAFLGSQGDPWDAQEDMLMDSLGAVFSLCLYPLLKRGAREKPDPLAGGGKK